jgi:hypothetical protein
MAYGINGKRWKNGRGTSGRGRFGKLAEIGANETLIPRTDTASNEQAACIRVI